MRRSETQLSKVAVRPATLSFGEHLRELRKRFTYVAISVIAWSGGAYAIEHRIIDALLRPAHGQSFIYTSPIDGVNFLFKLCTYVGIVCSIPVIIYQILKYIEPLMQKRSARFVGTSTLISGILALCGMAFGYFIGLPAALHFLLHQFITAQIHPLLTIDAYLSFVIMYMFGSALMFQIPLIILFINRVKPLTPRGLFKHERWVILFAVVLGGLMNPTPNIFDQLFVVAPIILSYQLSIVIVWWQNRKPRHVVELEAMRNTDAQAQTAREVRLRNAQRVCMTEPTVAPKVPLMPKAHTTVPVVLKPGPQGTPLSAPTVPRVGSRPRKYIDLVAPRPNSFKRFPTPKQINSLDELATEAS